MLPGFFMLITKFHYLTQRIELLNLTTSYTF